MPLSCRDVPFEPTDVSTEPSKYSPGLLRLITITRVSRDLFLVAIGITLIVIAIVAPAAAGDSNRQAWLIGLIMMISFSIGALWHAAVPFDRDWPRWVRFLVSLGGIGLGWLLLAYALGGTGVLGERADATLINCRPESQYVASHTRTHLLSGGTQSDRITVLGCDAPVRWPDGSQEAFGVVGRPPGTVETFVKPGKVFAWAFDGEPAYPWPEALALGTAGGLMILQAVYSLVTVIIGGVLGSLRSRRPAADLPPSQLPG